MASEVALSVFAGVSQRCELTCPAVSRISKCTISPSMTAMCL